MPGFRPATKQKYLPQQPATDPSWSQLSPHHAIMTLPTKEHRRGWSPAQINGMLWSYQTRRLIKPRPNDSLVCTEEKPNLVLMTYGTCKGLILNNIKKNVLVHEISDKSYNNVALNLEFPGKKSRNKVQQHKQPTCDTTSGNGTRARAVGSERSHHCAIPALHFPGFDSYLRR